MRLYFCGGLDCPDWVLAQIAYASKLTSLKFKSIFKEVASSISTGRVDDAAIDRLVMAGKFDRHDIKPCFAATSFIIKSACSHNVGVEILNDELQQLGLPKEHAQALCKFYASEFDTICESLCQNTLKRNELVSLDCSSITIPDDLMTQIAVRMNMRVRSASTGNDSHEEPYSILVTPAQVALLIDDLKKVAAEAR